MHNSTIIAHLTLATLIHNFLIEKDYPVTKEEIFEEIPMPCVEESLNYLIQHRFVVINWQGEKEVYKIRKVEE